LDIAAQHSPVRTPADAEPLSTEKLLSDEVLLSLYRVIVTSRYLDDKEIKLKYQNKVHFHLSSAGHEAVTAVAGLLLRPSYDWFYPHYRDRALCLQLGMSPYEQLLSAVAACDDPNSGGRQMPSHWGSRRLNIVSQSSPTGTQYLQAVGAAEASYRFDALQMAPDTSFHADDVVYVSSGEGTTSQGEFWESLNTACNLRLPVLYLIEDNEYAISVPVEVQTAGASISGLVRGFPGLLVLECDGASVFESYNALSRALEYCRGRHGPALVHAHVIRPYSHSVSDDEQQYRAEEERIADARRDPMLSLRQYLLARGISSESDLVALEAEVAQAVEDAAERALAVSQPSRSSCLLNLYSPDTDPTSCEFDTEQDPQLSGTPRTMADLLNRCLHEEMARNDRMLVFGQDVADLSRAENLDRVKGKGGVFKVTANLQRKFGSVRCFNAPLAEANIIGRAVGLATRGWKPVVEIQFLDYIWSAFMQLKNEVPTLRWRSNGAWKCPIVVRVPAGGFIRGGGPYHSQSAASLFTAIPGWRVIMPSSALDASGLLRTAIRCDDPVLFLEHKHLYRQTYNRSSYPQKDFMIPFGKAKIVRTGEHLTIVTYGALVQRSILAARLLEKEGFNVEVIDLRSLKPYDWEAVQASVKKTSRALIAYEDPREWGYGAELASRISEELFRFLDAPVGRVGSLDTFVGYAPDLEEVALPQVSNIVDAAEVVLKY
jgi:2-oxoisovalerate dehydrogenase E1 component